MTKIKSLGRLNKIISLIPGMGSKLSPEKVNEAEQQLQLTKILIDSMTHQERENPLLTRLLSRKQRILKGSGRSEKEFNKIFNDFERFKKTFHHLSKFGVNNFNFPGSNNMLGDLFS
jgi:signal recognition particle subunit SRP54